MPRYEYHCELGHLHEEERKFDEDQKVTSCPECDRPLKRIWTTPSVEFKGNGWYNSGVFR
jgi:putative FmdB family regulatory protein